MWAPFFQFASRGPRHVNVHRVAGMRGQGDSCTRSPSPRAPPRSVRLPARPSSHLPTHIPLLDWGLEEGCHCRFRLPSFLRSLF